MKNRKVIALLTVMSLSVSIPVNAMASEVTTTPVEPVVSDAEVPVEDTEKAENTDQGEESDTEVTPIYEVTDSVSIESITESIKDIDKSDEVVPSQTLEDEATQGGIPNTVEDEAPVTEVPPEEEQSPFEIEGTTLVRYTGTDEEVTVPDGVTHIDKAAFKDNSTMRKVILPDSCETLLDSTFTTCSNLQDVVINSKNISFGNKVFGDAPLTVYGYPYSETRVYCEKFENITFVALEQPEEEQFTIDENGKLTRYWGTDEEVIVPVGVASVSAKAFIDNSTMKKVVLPDTCKTVNTGAFTRCTALEQIELTSRETKFASNIINTPSRTIEVIGFLYSQPYHYCEEYDYLTFTAKDNVSESIKEIPADPETLTDGNEQLDLYKITVKDIIHGYSEDKVIERNILVPESGRSCSELVVNGSHFVYKANEDILSDSKGYTLVSPEVVEGTVNGTDIEVSFHYTYDGDSIRYEQEEAEDTKQYMIYCDVSVADGLSGDYYFDYDQSGSSSTHKDRINCLRYVYDADGTLKEQDTMSNGDCILRLENGYAKLQKISGSSTIYQDVPTLFGKAGIQEHLALDENGGIQDSYGNHYRVVYDVDENTQEDVFELKGGSGGTAPVGSLTIKPKAVDGYLATPTPEFEVTTDGLLGSWKADIETSVTDSFVENPVTGEKVISPEGVLVSIRLEQSLLWEAALDTIEFKGVESIDAGFYATRNGGIVFVPDGMKLENRRYPMPERLSQLRAITEGQTFMVNKNEAVVIGIKNKSGYCEYDSASQSWVGNHVPDTGELCKDSEGNVYVCQYPVGTAPDTWGYIAVPSEMVSALEKLI